MRRRSFLVSSAILPAISQAALPEDTLLKAMCDTLKCSLKILQLENLEKPYFLSYRITEITTVSASASFGALSSSGESRR